MREVGYTLDWFCSVLFFRVPFYLFPFVMPSTALITEQQSSTPVQRCVFWGGMQLRGRNGEIRGLEKLEEGIELQRSKSWTAIQ